MDSRHETFHLNKNKNSPTQESRINYGLEASRVSPNSNLTGTISFQGGKGWVEEIEHIKGQVFKYFPIFDSVGTKRKADNYSPILYETDLWESSRPSKSMRPIEAKDGSDLINKIPVYSSVILYDNIYTNDVSSTAYVRVGYELHRNFYTEIAKSEINAEVNSYIPPTPDQYWFTSGTPYCFCIVGRYPTWEYRFDTRENKYCPYLKQKLWMKIMKFPIYAEPMDYYITSVSPSNIEEVPNFYFARSNNIERLDELLSCYDDDYNVKYDVFTFQGRQHYFSRVNSLVNSIKELVKKRNNLLQSTNKEKCDKVRNFTNLLICGQKSNIAPVKKLANENANCIREIASFLEGYADNCYPPTSQFYIRK